VAEEVALWLSGDVQKELHRHGMVLTESPLTAERLASLLRLLHDGTIHGKIAKSVLTAIFTDDMDPEKIIASRGLTQITDTSELTAVITTVLDSNAAAVEQIRQGDDKPRGFLVGQVMRATGGRAEPAAVQQVLTDLLNR
jgi:aspartyl-tRNA(Asn)/glutamyl-tRNA(Gln) amidotransferase subunit B